MCEKEMKIDSRSLVVILLILGIIVSAAIGVTAVLEFGDERTGKFMISVTVILAFILGHKTTKKVKI